MSSDPEYNPLIDEESSSGSYVEARYLELQQLLVQQREEIDSLKECISEINEKLEDRDRQLFIMRGTIRRVRFNSEAQSSKERRNHVFFDASRRKFLQAWDGTLGFFKGVPMEQLAFLAHVLDLPAEGKDE